MKDYLTFVNEAKVAELIPGTYVICSKNISNFYDEKIKVKNKIAVVKKIMPISNAVELKFFEEVDGKKDTLTCYSPKDLELVPNDIVEKLKSGDLMVYLASDRLKDIFKRIHFKPTEYVFDISHFDIDDETPDMLTYYPAGKIKGIISSLFNPKQRQKMKVGRLLKKLNPELKESEIEQLIASYKAIYKIVKGDYTDKLRVVVGEEIRYWYHWKNYSMVNKDSDLNNSCMRYEKCQKKMGLYVENPDKIALAILLDHENKLLARALIWKLDSGKVYMDRIYAIGLPEKKILENYAKEKGMVSYGYKGEKKVSFNKDYGASSKNPYMDSMDYFVITHDGKYYMTSSYPNDAKKVREYDDAD
jgi:hypothetical protein